MTAKTTTAPFRWRTALIAGLVTFSCLGACWIRLGPSGLRPDRGLVVAESVLNFGEVWAQREFPWELPIQNTTSLDIEITTFRSSCGCSAIEPQSLVIRAGQTERLTLTLDLRESPSRGTAAGSEFSTDILAFTKHQPQAPDRFRLRGRVRPHPIVPSEHVVVLTESLAGGLPSAERKLDLHSTEPLARVTVAHEPGLQVQVDPIEDPLHCQLRLRLSSKLSAGDHRIGLRIVPWFENSSACTNVPPLDLEVRGRVRNAVHLVPSMLSFGAAKVGTTVEETVVMVASEERPFRLLHVGAEDRSAAEVREVDGSPSRTRTFQVRQRIVELGSKTEQVDFTVQEEGRAEPYLVPLVLSYHGIPR